MAYTNRFPKLSLTAQGGLESEEFANFMRSPMYFLSAGILGPIFDGGKRQAQYRAGQAAYEQQTYAYRNTVIQAFTEARNAIINYRQTAQAAQSWKQLEQSSKTALDLAQLQYINGVVAYLNVLDAQRSYFDAQIGLSNATRDRHLEPDEVPVTRPRWRRLAHRLKLQQHYSGCRACSNLLRRPYGSLNLANMRFLQKEHAQTALPYTAANRQRQFSIKKHFVEIKGFTFRTTAHVELPAHGSLVDAYAH